jgi:hypothetical protein
MKLYRGYKTEPRFLTKDLEYELRDLQALFDEDELPKGSIGRFKELRQISQDQFFSDDRQTASDSAGENGFLMEIDVDDRTTFDHYRGDQAMAPKREMRCSSNFFSFGSELARNLKNWKITVINLAKERERKTDLPKMPLR